MCRALADATTPVQVRSILAAFLVGDIVLGMVAAADPGDLPVVGVAYARHAAPRHWWKPRTW